MTRAHNPTIAWPTVALWLVCLVGWVAPSTLAILGLVSPWIAVPVASLSLYLAFTPMHDSAHRTLSQSSWLNDFVGRVCGVMLCAPFAPFKYAHLRHHHHTNHPEKDPDAYSGQGPKLLLPLRWVTQDWHYYVVYIRAWSTRPVKERVETVLTLFALVGLLSGIVVSGYGLELVLYWLIPVRVAIGLLAFLFDYLPHRPHQTLARKDPHGATHNLGRRWLTPVMLYQNYHLSHHLYPGVPFYRYKESWDTRFPDRPAG